MMMDTSCIHTAISSSDQIQHWHTRVVCMGHVTVRFQAEGVIAHLCAPRNC